MKNSEFTYDNAIQEIRNNLVVVNDDTLERIKSKFSHVINSTRASFYVRTLIDLVNLLELRAIDGRNQEEFTKALVECVKLNKSETCSNSTEDQEIPRHVLDMIAGEIGRKWWDLARSLDISEGTIAEIEGKYHFSLKQQAYQCLLSFCNQPENDRKVSLLLGALENARRVDLRTKVERELSNKNGQKKK